VDHNGPKPPTAIAIVGASSTSITMTWEPAHGHPAHEFALFRNGEDVASTAETSYTFTGLSCGTSYTLGVEALDSAGSRSELVSIIAAPEACPAPAPAPPSAAPTAPVPPEPSPEPSPPKPSPPTEPVSPAPSALEPEPPVTPPESGAPSAGMSWSGAGAFVWHETDVAPETLGSELRANGFSWVAVRIHDGLTVDPIEDDWVRRFRAASGLSVGGWGVLRTEPEREADLAHGLLDEYGLDFYIANPEAEYKYSNDDGQSGERYGRSQRFVERFRALEPEMPAGVSSYCRADTQDIDWGAWSDSGFVFLPQAYVNDLGSSASPSACVQGAAGFFTTDAVHPTVGVYPSQGEATSTENYAALLHEAGTIGFSVYLAETRMDARDWNTFGRAIAELEIARVISGAQLEARPPL
jgi:Fibronectin type III domain